MSLVVGRVDVMALPQIVTKTYSRRRLRQSDVSHAERTFDEVFHGDSRPPARTSATAEKWGTASFKRICNATRTSPKRRLSPTHDSDDPFSFDSDDDHGAKKLKKENVRQKTGASSTTKLTASLMDGSHSDDSERHAVGEKAHSRLLNCKEKSSADHHTDDVHRSETRRKLSTEKVTRCRSVVKAGLQSVHCTDSKRNGLSSHQVATASMSAGGDSLRLSDSRSNGVDNATGSCDKKPSSRTVGRNTRSNDPASSSPCKSTQQLKVFVDNFQLLLSSQRSADGQCCRRDASVSSGKLSHAGQIDPSAAKSKSSDNCGSDSGHSPSSVARRGHGSLVKTASSLSTSLQHGKHLHQNATDVVADDDSIDGDDVILLSPLPAKPSAVHSVGSKHTASNISGITSSPHSTSSSSSSPRKTRSGTSSNSLSPKSVASSGSNKNKAAVYDNKSVELKLHRWRTTDESAASDTTAAAAAAAAASTTTSVTSATATRRLLTGSRKVSYHLLYYILGIYTLSIDKKYVFAACYSCFN